MYYICICINSNIQVILRNTCDMIYVIYYINVYLRHLNLAC